VKHRPKLLTIAAASCAAVLIPVALTVRRWAGSAAVGTVATQISTQQPQPSLPEPLLIKTAYFSTTLPISFSLKTQTETPTDPLIQLRLVAATDTTTDQQFAATWATLPSDGLSSIGDYHLRASSGMYGTFTPPELPTGAVAFHAISGPANIVVFWTRGDHYVELAFSTNGSASSDQLQNTYQQVIRHWAW